MASQWIYVGAARSGNGTRWSRIVPPRENLGGQDRGSWLSQDRGLDVLIDPTGLALPNGRRKMTVADFLEVLQGSGSVGPAGPAGPTGPAGPAPSGTGAVIVSSGTPATVPLAVGQVAVGGPVPTAQGIAPVFNVRSYGAVGNGTADDSTAVDNMTAAALAAGGVGYFPPGTYKVMATKGGSGINWQGVPGQSIIKAGTAMHAVLNISGTSNVSGLIADGNNNLAQHGFLLTNASEAHIVSCVSKNVPRDGFRAGMGINITLGTVTQAGGGPAVTLSAADPNFALPFTNKIKITLGGVIGSGSPPTYQTSNDNGVTYSGVDRIFYPDTYILNESGGILTDEGILMSSSGTMVLNTTYAFTNTVTQNINLNSRFIKCGAVQCGSVFCSSAYAAGYTFITPTVMSGQATTSAGNQIVLFPSGGVLATKARNGDVLVVNGQIMLIAAVMSDFAVAVEKFNPPTGTGSFDFGFVVGSGWFEDQATGGQTGSVLDQCYSINCGSGVGGHGLGGPTCISFVAHFYSGIGAKAGTGFAD